MKSLERQATNSYKLVKNDLREVVAAVDVEKMGEFVNENIKDPLLVAGQQVNIIIREDIHKIEVL